MLNIRSIPFMYHPTNVVFLDDDAKFLNNLCMNLDITTPYVDDTDPNKIMSYLKTHIYRPRVLFDLIIKQTFDNLNNSGTPEIFALDYSQLLSTLASPARFKKCVHGFIDRAMKVIDGTEFCASLKEENIPIKIHLFTGETSMDEAVDLFNRSIIDGFLVKQGSVIQLAQKVNKLIQEFTWRQFVELGEFLGGMLSYALKPLYDDFFIHLFMDIYNKYQVVEFYLLDSSCSFLLLDADGYAKQLFVRNEADFKDCYEIAKDAKVLSYEKMQAILERQMFPYTKRNMGYLDLEGDQWEDTMIYMDKVPGRELYYAVLDRPDIEAYSFNKYMQEEWPKP